MSPFYSFLEASREYMDAFDSVIQRWIERASQEPMTMTKDNLPPFTMTGDYNDAAFPMRNSNKEPWWIGIAGFDHSSPTSDAPDDIIGSWFNYDEAHLYFEKLIDPDIHFQRQIKATLNDRESDDSGLATLEKNSYVKLNTYMQKGTVAWDFMQHIDFLREYRRRETGKRLVKGSPGWLKLVDIYVRMISGVKDGKIKLGSDLVQGRIGRREKSKENIRKRNELDNPMSKLWSTENRTVILQRFIGQQIAKREELGQSMSQLECDYRIEALSKFIDLKIQHTLELQRLCEAQANKQ